MQGMETTWCGEVGKVKIQDGFPENVHIKLLRELRYKSMRENESPLCMAGEDLGILPRLCS